MSTSSFPKVALRLLAVGALTLLPAALNAAGPGRLYLVSTGAGDPDNMTLRAHKVIQEAQIVFTMRGDAGRYGELLKGKELHAAGHGLFPTRKGEPDRSPGKGQGKAEELNAQRESVRRIIREGIKAGKTVAILENGDPTIFGPQLGYLAEFADLSPSIVPGLSSFNAANAALRQSVVGGVGRSITLSAAPRPRNGEGKEAAGKGDPREGLVFFTMRSDLTQTVAELGRHYPQDTPIAIVMHAGDSARERVLRGTLADIVAKLGKEKLPFEHLIYVGSFLR